MVTDTKVVTRAVDEHVAALEEERLPDEKWHPSSFWTCTRAAIMGNRAVPVTNPPDLQSKRIFRIGHIYHAFVQQALGLSPDFVNAYAEVGIEVTEWNMTGHGDVLVEFKDGHWELFEIKSTKSLKYTPKDDHRKQATCYFVAIRDFGYVIDAATDGLVNDRPMPPLGEALTHIRLIYLNKTDLEMKEYLYEYTPAWRTLIEQRLEELGDLEHAEIEELPVIEKDNWFTGYCPYKGSGKCCGDKGVEQVVKEAPSW